MINADLSPPLDDASQRPQVVILGASNLARGISTVVETARLYCDTPIDILAAVGHGRSYGQTSSLLGRRLPGIVQCGLWDRLQAPRAGPALALVTDVGNDLMFGVPPQTIAGWVESCLDRLIAVRARIVMTLLPLANLESLSRARFLFFRTVFFPRCQYDLPEIARFAHALNERLEQIGRARGVQLARPDPDWYHIDPIHIRIRRWPDAWGSIMSAWSDAVRPAPPARGSLRQWLYLRTRRPEHRYIFGRSQRREQPAGMLSDGTSIGFF